MTKFKNMNMLILSRLANLPMLTKGGVLNLYIKTTRTEKEWSTRRESPVATVAEP